MITPKRTPTSSAVRIALLIAVAGALSACVSIPQRAWRNGQAMSNSLAYQAVMSGDMSFKAHQELEASLNPLRTNYRDAAYKPFGDWWWP
ncbi:MAG TPA: hypothetical protein VGM67_01365 [Gemmatimonadaceae bacterium]|jgi:hypothetical protein